MPSWKKVIVSGSDAALNSLNVTNGVTGSLFGTASYATSASQAITSSYSNYALTASNSQNAQDLLIYVKNTTGAQINKGTVVRISGATGDNALISTASYESDSISANTLGITNQNIPNDSFGYVITEGTFIGFDTSTPGWVAGQLLYLGANGTITGSAPQAPLHAVRLGQVLRVQAINGSMYVRIDNGYELGELHDIVDNTTTSSYGDLLVKSGSVWTNSRQLTGSYGLTGSLQATSFTGSLFGTASYATSASQAISSSFAINASSSLFTVSSSRSISSSFATIASSSLFSTSASQATSASFAINASSSLFAVSSSRTISSSFATIASSSLFATSASQAISSSFAVNASSSLFATTAGTATTATNATNVAVTDTTSGTGPYYLMFADGTTGNRATRVDSSTLTFNATTNTLTVTNLTGTASYATSASQAISSSFATNTSSSLFATSASQAVSSSFAINASSSLQATNALSSSKVRVSDLNTTSTPQYVTFVSSQTDYPTIWTDIDLTYVPNTNTLSVTSSYATSASQAISSSFATVAQSVLGTITNASTASNITPAITNALNNRVLTANGGGTINGEANLTFNGTTLGVTGSLEQGFSNITQGDYSHAEGSSNIAAGNYSHAEGAGTYTIGFGSHAEGDHAHAKGQGSHAEGYYTSASGNYSHAEGETTLAGGVSSHAEGLGTFALGDYSHAEGTTTIAFGEASHAEGDGTYAGGFGSHAAGYATSASGNFQSVIGATNLPSTNPYAFIIGNGKADLSLRSNLLYASGSNVQITGSLYISRSDNQTLSSVFTSPGSKTNPAYTFIGDEDTGMFKQTTNTVGLSGGGNIRVLVSDAELYLNPGTTTFQENILTVSNDSIPLVSKTPRASVTVGSASYAEVAQSVLGTITSASFAINASSSLFAVSSSRSVSSSFATLAASATTATSATSATSASFAINASSSLFAVSSSRSVSSSFATLAASATSANTLTNTRTIWGQNFNGSANVTGNLTSVGTISGSTGVDLDIIAGSGARITLMNPGADSVRFGTSNTVRWSVDGATGNLISAGAQTITTSTGNLTLATNAGDGNILLTPNGTGRVGINTITPTSASLTVNGNIWATSLTGSLLGTASIAANSAQLSGLSATSFVLNSQTSSMAVLSASFAANASSSLFATSASQATSASFAINASSSLFAVSSSRTISSSFATIASSSLFATSASQATSASFAVNASSSLFATTAGTATTATNANNVAVTDTTSGTGPFYLMFADGTTGNRATRVDSSTLTFNATTNTLTVPNLAGTASLATTASHALGADNIRIQNQDTTPVTFNITFAGVTSGITSLNVDQTALLYTPSTSTFTTPIVNSTTAVQGGNGSIAAPAFSFSGDTNTGMYTTSSDTLGFSTAGTARMSIDASGRVGIGTPSMVRDLQVGAFSGSPEICIASSTTGIGAISFGDGATGNDPWRGYIQYNHSSDALIFGTANGERARIDSTGNTGIGGSPSARLDVQTTGTVQTSILGRGSDSNFRLTTRQDVSANTDGSVIGELGIDYTTTRNSAIRFHRGGSTTGGFISFTTDNGSERARITSGGAMGLGVTPTNTAGRFEASNDIVAYSTSDKRWKNNIVKINSPLEKISQISGVEFDWIEDEPLHGNKGHDVGVIAQEIELVIPEAVQTRESGMKAVQYDKIIPLLIESIKEQQKQIDELKELVNKLTK